MAPRFAINFSNLCIGIVRKASTENSRRTSSQCNMLRRIVSLSRNNNFAFAFVCVYAARYALHVSML